MTLKSDVFSPGPARFNCSLSNYNGQVEVLSFQIGDEVLSCNLDPCSFQDNIAGIHATDFNFTTNSFYIAVENITSYNGSTALCSASVGNSTVIESNRITTLVVLVRNIEPGMSLITEFEKYFDPANLT